MRLGKHGVIYIYITQFFSIWEVCLCDVHNRILNKTCLLKSQGFLIPPRSKTCVLYLLAIFYSIRNLNIVTSYVSLSASMRSSAWICIKWSHSGEHLHIFYNCFYWIYVWCCNVCMYVWKIVFTFRVCMKENILI